MRSLSVQYAKRVLDDGIGETVSLESELTSLESLFDELQEECATLESLAVAEQTLREHPELAPSVEAMIDDYLDQNEIIPSMEKEQVEADGKVRSVMRRVWDAIVALIKKIGRGIRQFFYKLFANQERIKKRAKRRVDKLNKSRKSTTDTADFTVMPVIAQWIGEKPFTPNSKYPALDMRKLAIAVHSSANRAASLGKDAIGEKQDAIRSVFEWYLKDIHGAFDGIFVPYQGLAKNYRTTSVDPSKLDAPNSLKLLQAFRQQMQTIEITFEAKRDQNFHTSRGEVLAQAEKLVSEIDRLDHDAAFSQKAMEGAIDTLEKTITKLKNKDMESEATTPWAMCMTSMLHITQFASTNALRSAKVLSSYHENVGRYLDTAISHL